MITRNAYRLRSEVDWLRAIWKVRQRRGTRTQQRLWGVKDSAGGSRMLPKASAVPKEQERHWTPTQAPWIGRDLAALGREKFGFPNLHCILQMYGLGKLMYL